MRALALAEYTTAGAVAGAAFTGLGATICHAASPDAFDRRAATMAGLLGGAVSHAALGVFAAVDPHPAMVHRLRDIGASLPLAALTAGVIGGAILSATGHEGIPRPGALTLAGILGGVILASAAATATCLSLLVCAPRPGWTRLVAGDMGEGQRLADEEAQAEAPRNPEGHRSLAERLLPFEPSHSAA